VAARFPYGQWVANGIMAVYFAIIYRGAPERLRRLMLYGVFVAIAGEVVFSLLIGMYEYRLANVPLYVPPGHAILYACVYYFVREPLIARNRRWLLPLLLALGFCYSAVWLVTRGDVWGAVCTALFVYLIWRHPDSRLFFAAMFLFVAFLELVGTGFEAWYWHPTLLDRFDWMPSGNPPSGIAVFYFGFDAACLDVYASRHPKVTKRYMRLRAHLNRKPAAAFGTQEQSF
jgi:hypothetical protein